MQAQAKPLDVNPIPVTTTAYYPVLMVRNVEASARFYEGFFGLKRMFSADWYVHLQSPQQRSVNLAFVDYRHTTIPDGCRHPATGVLINFEVKDPDQLYAQAQAMGLEITLALKDEPFGQRHFIIRDPDGVLVDIIKPIPPAPEFAAAYDPAALPVS